MRTLTSKETRTNLLIIFFLWPVAALFESIRNYRASWAKNGFWLFVIFFGFTFVSQEGQDSTRYILYFQELHRSDADFTVLKSMIYIENSRFVDILQPLITFAVAKFTGDSRVLFAVFGLIFGFFYTRNIWYLIDKTEGKLNNYLIILIVLFALIVPIWFINGFRFWTAAHIFFYGALPFLLDGKKRGLWISALSVFMHFSFIFPVLILLIYRLIGNRTTIFLIFFVISNFISEINIPFIRNTLIAYSPAVFHSRINSYVNEESIAARETVKANLNWYITWHKKAFSISIYILLLVIFFEGKEIWAKKEELLRLFSYVLLFGGFANIFSQIPSGSRFQAVGTLFYLAFIFLYLYYNHSELLSRKLFILLTPAIALFLIVTMRIGFDNIGLYTFFINPFIAPFLTNEIALIDLIK